MRSPTLSLVAGLLISSSGLAAQLRRADGRRTPYIENVVVVLKGADDRIRELLTHIEWKVLNRVQTR